MEICWLFVAFSAIFPISYGHNHGTTYADIDMTTEQEITVQPDVLVDPTTAAYEDDAVFRLVNGSSAHEGRIEVYHAGRWGTVCGDSFGYEEGFMVCRMLGYDDVSSLAPGPTFGEGIDPIWLDDLNCPWYANTLADCTHNDWGWHNCGHWQDMGLICMLYDRGTTYANIDMTTDNELTVQPEIPVDPTTAAYEDDAVFRLVNGSSAHEGRIEVYHAGLWGTVCGDSFGYEEGNMVCRMLGYDYVWILLPRAAFGEGVDPIWLDDLNCPWYASTLADCTHRGWGSHNCGHSEDMGLICGPYYDATTYANIDMTTDQEITVHPEIPVDPTTAAYEDDAVFRLVNGSSAHEGRIEVYHAGLWGTVCDDSFGYNEGNMICRMLGYDYVWSLLPRATFGEGADPIWLDDLSCPWYASTLAECTHRGWGSHNCGHSEDMGLICQTYDDATTYANIDITTDQEITVRPNVPVDPTTAAYEDDAVFRLVNGSSAHEGRIEVYHAGLWGTVCDDSFGYEEGNMVCRMLGYDYVWSLLPRAAFGEGVDPIWLDDLNCPWYASTLAECTHRGWGSHNCGHSEDMGLICAPNYDATTYANIDMTTETYPEITTFYPRNSDIEYRLVGGSRRKGRIEVLHNGRWGTICDDGFGWEEAHTICRQLGFQVAVSLYPEAQLGAGAGQIWLDDLRCSRDDLDLERCSHRGWGVHNCGHHEDMGVRCGY